MNNSLLDTYINEFLHVNDVDNNKLIDLTCGQKVNTFRLKYDGIEPVSSHVIKIVANRLGKPGNTILRYSASNLDDEQVVGENLNYVDWENLAGNRYPQELGAFIDKVYKELTLKGNNPTFLSVGSVEFKVSKNADDSRIVKSPLILFPIRLIRSDNSNTPVYIEFVNDEIHLNPCLLAKLRLLFGDKIVDEFPNPNGKRPLDDEIGVEFLGVANAYLNSVSDYIDKQKQSAINSNTVFNFNKDDVFISEYNHDEICIYYDIKRNRDKIYSHKLINRIFNKNEAVEPSPTTQKQVNTFLPTDSVQTDIIKRVVNGESLIIKGPPGTGKTLTITNVIAALLSDNKKVLLSSTKLAAMNEVFNKLGNLNKFALLLDSETESQTVKINPVEIRKNLASIIKEKGEYNANSAVETELNLAIRERTAIIQSLNDYLKSTQASKDVLGVSYYEALNEILDIYDEPINYADSAIISMMDSATFKRILSMVEAAADYYNKICGNYTYLQNPFVPTYKEDLVDDIEGLLAIYNTINEKVACLKEELTNAYGCEYQLDGLKLLTLYALSKTNFNEDEILEISNKINNKQFSKIETSLLDYLSYSTSSSVLVNKEITNEAITFVSQHGDFGADLTLGELKLIVSNERAQEIAKSDDKLNTLIGYCSRINEIKAEIAAKIDEFNSVFITELSEENVKRIDLAVDVFAKYCETDLKPKALDFKAKSFYKDLKGLGYGAEIPFADVVKALKIRGEIFALNASYEEKIIQIRQLFKILYTQEEIETILLIVNKAISSKVRVTDYLKSLLSTSKIVLHIASLTDANDATLLVDIFDAVAKEIKLINLKNAVEFVFGAKEKVLEQAFKCVIVENLAKMGIENTYDFLSVSISPEVSLIVSEIFKLLKTAKDNYYETYYSNFYQLTLNDFNVFVAKSEDRNAVNAVREYVKIINTLAPISANKFFAPYELGERKTDNIVNVFKKSTYVLAINHKLAKKDFDRNGLGEKVERLLNDFNAVEKKISAVTEKIIEKQCFSRIDTNAHNIAFLNSERAGETLRKLFKNHPSEILNLKKCFILSPPTASVLLRSDEYSNFDTVIIDEASQLEPKDILPVLFRAKQVVLVGDEWQMPPIKHFSQRSKVLTVAEDGEFEFLSPDTSVLSLALKNNAFTTKQLSCHYRSKTESLIAFSQKHYYDYMRTFPAAVPKTDEVGFKDFYVEGATVVSGVNKLEAIKVVEQLNEHFNKYYNPQTEVLSRTVGVVAFGKKQIDYIISLVEKDSELNNKIRLAILKAGVAPEKTVFFKTIETVQGQETDSLILSLTYGRNASGEVVQRFGELNVGAGEGMLGQCIFNVAVTRAKESVTLIRSVEPTDIDNSSIIFIREYIELVKRFATDGKMQFVGKQVSQTQGFVRAVADYLISIGISEERLVADCGVTNGSVKVPLVVLSQDLSKAELGMWCEQPLSQNYLDNNSRYVESLVNRGWDIARVFIHDWYDNNKFEKEKIKDVIQNYVTI